MISYYLYYLITEKYREDIMKNIKLHVRDDNKKSITKDKQNHNIS